MHPFSEVPSLLSYRMVHQACCQVCIFRCSCKPILLQGRTAAQAIPAVLAEEQWEALGLRLRGIENSMQVSAAAREHSLLFRASTHPTRVQQCHTEKKILHACMD
jgi:hypothetical protein